MALFGQSTSKIACLPALAVLAAPNFEPIPARDSASLRFSFKVPSASECGIRAFDL
jgi:hypothetical protein